MLLICTPAIDVSGSFIDIATPSVALGGSFVDTVTPHIAVSGSFVDIVTPYVTVSGSLVDTVTPRIAVVGSFIDTATPKITIGGSFVDRGGVAMSTSGSAVEVCALVVAVGGSTVFFIDPDAEISAVFTALAMNAKTAGVALYAGFPMESMFKLGLEYYGITPDGLVRLSGGTDNGTDIDALIISAVSNLGTEQKKNIPEAYLTMRCEGDLELAVTFDERRRIIKEGSSGKRGLSDIRFPLPRGADGNQVQIQIRNIDGANFDLKEAQVIVAKRDRRR